MHQPKSSSRSSSFLIADILRLHRKSHSDSPALISPPPLPPRLQQQVTSTGNGGSNVLTCHPGHGTTTGSGYLSNSRQTSEAPGANGHGSGGSAVYSPAVAAAAAALWPSLAAASCMSCISPINGHTSSGHSNSWPPVYSALYYGSHIPGHTHPGHGHPGYPPGAFEHSNANMSLLEGDSSLAASSAGSSSPARTPMSAESSQHSASAASGGGGSGASNSNSHSRKIRRNRTVFTELQLMGLERRFDSQKYLSTPDRADLARVLGLTQLQVKTWYQNRRMKWKKQVMQGGCPIPPTKPKGRPKKNSIPSMGLNLEAARALLAPGPMFPSSTMSSMSSNVHGHQANGLTSPIDSSSSPFMRYTVASSMATTMPPMPSLTFKAPPSVARLSSSIHT